MNLQDLANRETELYKIVTTLHGTIEDKMKWLEKNGVFERYKEIHKAYTELHKQDLEALKRALFITWYYFVEPACFTGIGDLDAEAEEKIMRTLERRLRQNATDYELEWMLAYYANWDFVFERFNVHKELVKRLKLSPTELPASINKQEMAKRGQMGIYWNSLTRFS